MRLFLVFSVLCFACASLSYAAGEGGVELAKEDMIEEIKGAIDTYGEEIILAVPGLAEKGSGEIIDFNKLDDDALQKLHLKVINQAGILHRKNLNAQMEQFKRIQDMQRQQEMSAGPQAPHVPEAPRVPEVPGIPAAPPRIPALPEER